MAKNLDDPVVYVKGDVQAMAYTVDDEVRLKYQGYRPQSKAGDTGNSSGSHVHYENEVYDPTLTLHDYRESVALSPDDEDEDDDQ